MKTKLLKFQSVQLEQNSEINHIKLALTFVQLDSVITKHFKFHFKISQFSTIPITECPGFGWDRVNFLPSSWYSTAFWIQYENNVDNTLMFSVVAKQCLY